MSNAGLDESQTGIKIARRNINNFRYADDTTLMAESEEELKNVLMKEKEESEKVGLKLNIKKTKIMASGPITSWQKWGNSGWLYLFINLDSKITAAMKLKDSYSLEETSLVVQTVKNLSTIRDIQVCWIPGSRRFPWRRKWQPTPVLLPGKSHWQRSLVGYTPWGHKELYTTKRLHFHFHY